MNIANIKIWNSVATDRQKPDRKAVYIMFYLSSDHTKGTVLPRLFLKLPVITIFYAYYLLYKGVYWLLSILSIHILSVIM